MFEIERLEGEEAVDVLDDALQNAVVESCVHAARSPDHRPRLVLRLRWDDPKQNNRPYQYYSFDADNLLGLALAIQRSLAPTSEDRILDALKRIEDRIPDSDPDR